MAENLVNFFIERLGGTVSREIIVFIISLFPILELRGGIIAAYALGMELLPSFVIAYIGNIIPIPFILMLIAAIFKLLKKTPFKKIVEKIEKKALSKSGQIEKYGYFGLFLFVAIPLPGTGGWTGALLAVLLGMNRKKSFLVIALGVFTAGIIISALSFGLFSAIGIG
ncbi:MAG: small multi-drug export protein [Firmicutes bacterium]|nr:small multi-drug export protein [Bacillota bacterium]